jgi:hypothetical protein
MKKMLVVAVLLVGSCSLNHQFVKSVDSCNSLILPEYKEYVAKDTSISDDTKRIRIRTADELNSMVKEALNADKK